MGETPEALYERSAGALRTPAFASWSSFPFDGDLRPKRLEPPVAHERPRYGEGGIDCRTCAAPDDAYLWTDQRWRIRAIGEPIAFPFVGFLEPRAHFEEPGDLPDDMAAEQGIVLARFERAIRSIGNVGRVHISRWGDGGAHLHWWFMARPARMPQIAGTFAILWDEVLIPMPPEVQEANVAAVAAALLAEGSASGRRTSPV